MRVLLVHGRAQGGNVADELQSTWVQSLQEGFREAGKSWPSSLQFDFPFYGDKLDELVARANLPTPSDVVAKGPGQNRQFEEFMQSALTEMQQNGGITDAEVEAHMPPGAPKKKGPQNWNWVQALARAIDNRWSGFTDWTIEKYLQDVFLYVTNRDVARQIDKIVEHKLTGDPTIVVAHSLGSVVAYNIINEHLSKLNLKKLITVGSPLGLRAISSKLDVPENPAGNKGWYNAYDERDIVALNPLDDTYFPTDPPIINNNGVKNKTNNRHGIIGYLNDKNVAAQVADALVRVTS